MRPGSRCWVALCIALLGITAADSPWRLESLLRPRGQPLATGLIRGVAVFENGRDALIPVPSSDRKLPCAELAPISFSASPRRTAVVALAASAAAAAMLWCCRGVRCRASSFLESSTMQSFLLLVLSEVGDKTFFMTAVMAARHGLPVAAISSAAALLSITTISVLIGQMCKFLASQPWFVQTLSSSRPPLSPAWLQMPQSLAWMRSLPISWADCLLISTFAWLGMSTLYESVRLADSGVKENEVGSAAAISPSAKWALIAQCCSMIFLAELGDRSFFSIFTLSVSDDVWKILLGTVLGQLSCIGLAIACGDLLARHVSEQSVSMMGGMAFLLFAALRLGQMLSRR